VLEPRQVGDLVDQRLELGVLGEDALASESDTIHSICSAEEVS
jgi:hypothetical protein